MEGCEHGRVIYDQGRAQVKHSVLSTREDSHQESDAYRITMLSG
jgi:hypothetical protein